MGVQKVKALIVDDDSRFSELLKKTLESKNCEVDMATNNVKALSLLIKNIYHVVFLDCVLKDKNGMEFSNQIKKVLGNSVQVIMMSGIVSSKSLSSYINLGVFDFLSKPISESEINVSLRKIKERFIQGGHDNILIKLFREHASQLDNLRSLVLLKKIVGYEFFLYLSVALVSKESLSLRFTFKGKTREILLSKGNFIDYNNKDSRLFIERLLSNNLIKPEDALFMKNKTEEECIEYLVSQFILSPSQILDFKYELLLETLKSIHPESEIPVNFEITKSKNEDSVILTQKEYADIVFICLKQKFNNKIFSLFGESIMKRHLTFTKEDSKNYPKELIPVIGALKSKLKLQAFHDKYINDKNIFCFCIFYILLRGDALISDETQDLSWNYLYERYKKLEKFIKKENRNQIFYEIGGIESYHTLSNEDKKEIYNDFIKKNHPDMFFKYNLSKEIINQINRTIHTFKTVFEEETNPKIKKEMEKERQEADLKSAMLTAENRKLMERYLAEGNYKSAGSVLKQIPAKVLEQELEWKLLVTWFYMRMEKTRKREKDLVTLMSEIQKNKRDLEKNPIYYHIVGLNYMKNKMYDKALKSFEVSKKIDYSFKSNYEEIRKCSLHQIKDSKKIHPFLRKLFEGRKKKKTG